jgi:hypothetical protein
MNTFMRLPPSAINLKVGDEVNPVPGARDIDRKVIFTGDSYAKVAEIIGSVILIDDDLNGRCRVALETINKIKN